MALAGEASMFGRGYQGCGFIFKFLSGEFLGGNLGPERIFRALNPLFPRREAKIRDFLMHDG